MRRFWSLVLACSMVLSMLPVGAVAETAGAVTFAGGSGTAEDPYQVATAAQLDAVRNDPAAHYVQTADIDMTGVDWLPIGGGSVGNNYQFTGSFDGGQYAISNLTISSELFMIGMFGYCQNAILENITLEELTITAGSESALGIIGGLVGTAVGSTITGCSVSGTLTADVPMAAYFGGLCAEAQGSTITECSSQVILSCEVGENTNGTYAGGIVGWAALTPIEDCANSGSITIQAGDLAIYAGGIVGRTTGAVTRCENSGMISVTSPMDAYAGGIAAEATGTVSLCVNTDAVSALGGSAGARAGGICGNGNAIQQCVNTGDVTASCTAALYAGGIAAYGSGQIENCFNTGAVTATADYDADASSCYAGGVAGYLNGTLDCVYSLGQLSAEQAAVAYEGALAAYAESPDTLETDLTDAYFCNCETFPFDGVGNGTGGISCTPAEMKEQDTFTGFDFNDIWSMDPDADYPYPTLQGLEVELPAITLQQEETVSGSDYYISWVLDTEGVLTVNGYTIPDYSTPNDAPWYAYRDRIRKVVLVNDSSISIGSYAFYDCSNLETVEFPQQGCSKIGSSAFANCTSLTKIVLWSRGSTLSIGNGAFLGCTDLETLGIPHEVKIESNAFASCEGLTDIYFTTATSNLSSTWFSAATDSFDAVTAIVHYPSGMSVSNSVKNGTYGGTFTWVEAVEGLCGNHALWTYDEDTQTLTISGSGPLQALQGGSVTPWTRLRDAITGVVVEEGITHLPSYTFEYLAAVTQVQLPDTLTVLAPNAFNDCSVLNDLYIPGSVTEFIADTDFNRCTALTDLYYPGTAEDWAKVENGADAITEAMTLHTLVLQSATATCTDSGFAAHYRFDDYAAESAYPGYYDLDKQPIAQPETIPATNHQWDAGAVTSAATCTAAGEMTYTCENDATHTKTEAIPMLEHADENGDKNCDHCGAAMCSSHVLEYHQTKPATCKEDGYVAHWHCASCDRYYDDQAGQHETNANDIRIQGGYHTPVTDAAVAPTCTETGLTEGSHCGACGAVLEAQETIPATDHKWDEGTVTSAATCTAAGEMTYTCENDATHTKTETIPMLEHADENGDKDCDHCGEAMCSSHVLEYHQTKPATCKEDGYVAHWHCASCDRYYDDQAGQHETNAQNIRIQGGYHTPVTDAAVAPSCTETGLTEGSHCGVCGEVLEAQLEVPMTDHRWQNTTDVFTQQCGVCQTTRTIVLTGCCGLLGAAEPVWTLTSDGTLTISGSGDMAEYTYSTYQEHILRVVIEEGSTSTDAAFRNFTNLVSVVLPDSMTNVNQLTFAGCTSLTDVDLGEGVTSLQLGTFSGCSALKTLAIPDSVTYIEETAFSGCTALETLTIGCGITEIDDNTFAGCTNLKTVTIDTYEEAVTMGENAFHEGTTVIFLRKKPASLVFDGGTGAEDDPYRVSNAQQLNAVRDYPTAHYIQTADIDLSGMDWTPIGMVYQYCEEGEAVPPFTGSYNGQDYNITGMTITGEYSIDAKALHIGLFGGTENASISNVHLSGGKIDITVTAGGSALCMGHIGSIVGSGATITDCSNANTICVTVHNPCGGEPFYIGGIGGLNNTVSGCVNTGSITVVSEASGVMVGGISGRGAVQTSWNCGSISVDSGTYDSVGGIVGELISGVLHQCCNTGTVQGGKAGGIAGSNYATIENCFNVGTVISPKAAGIVSCQRGTVNKCYNAGDVTGDGTYPATGGISYDNDTVSVTNAYYLDNVTAGNIDGTDGGTMCTAKELAQQSTFENFDFQYIWKIETTASYPYPTLVALDAVLPEIKLERSGICGDNAFWLLDDDGTLTISGTGDMYYYADGIRPWEEYCGEVLNIVLEEGITGAGGSAFYNCVNAATVSLPSTLTSMGSFVFQNCDALTEIVLPEGLVSVGDSVFSGCDNLKTASVPGTITTWGDYFFWDCTALETVTLGEGLTTIPAYMFSGCTALESLEIPDSVTEIRTLSFEKSGLKTVNIGSGIQYIRSRAFENCAALETAYIDAYRTQVTVEEDAFGADVAVIFKICQQDHLWGEGACTDIRTCTVCGEVEAQARGHQAVTDEAVAPTCTESGLTEGGHCGVCGEVLVAQETVPATEHLWNEGTVTVEPTCKTVGVKTFTCQNDGTHARMDELPMVAHADGDRDGKCDMCQLVTSCVVTFDTNGGAPVPQAQLLTPGSYVAQPEAPQRENYEFRGWFLEGEDGERWKFDQYTVEESFTLYAKWHKVKHNVRGQVNKHNGETPDETVKVSLQQGDKIICELETDENGCYQMEGIPAGSYNLVVEEPDGRSRTSLVEIWEDGQMETVHLPEHNVSTEIVVSGEGEDAILVDGLEQEADNSAVDGEHVKVTMKVGKTEDFTEREPSDEDKKAQKEAQKAIKEQAKENDEEEREYVFLEIEIKKQLENSEHQEITETSGLLEIRVPVETHGRRHFKVYRHHGEEVHQLSEQPNEHGEYIEIHDGYIIIYARHFSTYAITSLQAAEACQHEYDVRYVWDEVDCNLIRDCKYCEEQQEEKVTFTLKDSVLKLSAVPDGLMLLVAAYDGGRMTGCQLLDGPKAENSITVSGETVKIFFVKSNFEPRIAAR